MVRFAQRLRHSLPRPAALGGALLLVSASHGFAGAWTLPAGQGKLIASLLSYRADDRFDTAMQRTPQPAFHKTEFSPYLEYGVGNGLTCGGSLSLQRIGNRASAADTTNYGLAEAELFLRQRLWEGMLLGNRMAASAQPLVKLPGESRDDAPPLGSAHPDAGLSLHAGFDFSEGKRNHYVDFSIGYRKRFGEPADQLVYTETIAFSPAERVTLLLQSFGTYSMEGTFDLRLTQTPRDDYHLLKLQVSALVRMGEQSAVQVGAFRHVMGANTGAGHGFLLALWRDF